MPRSLGKYPQSFLLLAFAHSLKSIFFSKPNWQRRPHKQASYEKYRQTAYRLQRKGYIKITQDGASGQKFIRLTSQGQLELLLAKSYLQKPRTWDRKWRIIFFDIPEDASNKRDRLRRLLKANGFAKLQASVYINPYPLNREAINYLNRTGLTPYIRIGRLEELDNDSDLIMRFKLR